MLSVMTQKNMYKSVHDDIDTNNPLKLLLSWAYYVAKFLLKENYASAFNAKSKSSSTHLIWLKRSFYVYLENITAYTNWM